MFIFFTLAGVAGGGGPRADVSVHRFSSLTCSAARSALTRSMTNVCLCLSLCERGQGAREHTDERESKLTSLFLSVRRM